MTKVRYSYYPETTHRCPICGSVSSSIEVAFKCIQGHAVPEKIVAFENYSKCYNRPEQIHVLMSDGYVIGYTDPWTVSRPAPKDASAEPEAPNGQS